jgi:hypothetical protein
MAKPTEEEIRKILAGMPKTRAEALRNLAANLMPIELRIQHVALLKLYRASKHPSVLASARLLQQAANLFTEEGL